MYKLFVEGGMEFMSILTLEFLAMLVLVVYHGMSIQTKSLEVDSNLYNRLGQIKSIGLLALVTGIFAQLLGLYFAFEAISAVGEVSADILAKGLKISMIPTLYGGVIFITSYLLYFVLEVLINKKSLNEVK